MFYSLENFNTHRSGYFAIRFIIENSMNGSTLYVSLACVLLILDLQQDKSADLTYFASAGEEFYVRA